MNMMAFAGLALAAAVPAAAAAEGEAAKPAKEEQAEEEVALSADAVRVADWIVSSGDNGERPYAIIDKKAATIFLFDAEGKRVADAPVLIGIAAGDEATPGIGSKNLAEIGPAERTTPAGRFLARFGRAAGRQKVLWVDYATSVALHTIPPRAPKKEKRTERMLSETIDDNRITFGCINVPKLFYRKSLTEQFGEEGGYVYVLPDTKPLEAVFPRLHVEALAKRGATAVPDNAGSAGAGVE